MAPSAPALHCRQIEESDTEAVASLLANGFRTHDRQFWLQAFAQLRRHATPAGLPKFGYLLESDGRVVGAVLLICSLVRDGDQDAPRCNLSSWYVDAAFRAYAPMLVSRALRHKDVTYVNVSPAPHTRPIIEAQGFARYCDGIFVAVPMLTDLLGGESVRLFDAGVTPQVNFDARDQDILLRHAALGCVSLWCATADRAYPFVFRRRFVRRIVPCAQLIYCTDIACFVRFAGPIGRLLARRGMPFVIIDANAPIPGLAGWYSGGKMPKYFKGPLRPRLGDLAYTEHAVMGV
jgi:hypothetical protein